MKSVNVTMSVPKEGKELIDLLDSVLEKVMNKEPLANYATLFGEVSQAVDGIGSLKEELKSQGRDELAGYLVQTLLGRLLSPEEEAPAEPQV